MSPTHYGAGVPMHLAHLHRHVAQNIAKFGNFWVVSVGVNCLIKSWCASNWHCKSCEVHCRLKGKGVNSEIWKFRYSLSMLVPPFQKCDKNVTKIIKILTKMWQNTKMWPKTDKNLHKSNKNVSKLKMYQKCDKNCPKM